MRSCAGTAVTLAVLSAGCAESTPKSGNGGAASTAIERTNDLPPSIGPMGF
ncbi:putative lipoprotein [Burkholderia mallei PRL-20]|nr:putative lipoprotein [Burkholderia mallei PRL-20]